MFNFLLMDTTSSDRIPDGIASGLDFPTEGFTLGLVVGSIATFIIIGIIKYVKFIIKENEKTKENLKDSTKSE